MAGKKKEKETVIPEAISVKATTTVSGPPATSIWVTVDESELEEKVTGFTESESAFAVVPRVESGARTWTKEPLQEVGKRLTPEAHEVRTYEQTISGPSDVPVAGVKVGVETNVGTVWAQEPARAVRARPADEPEPEEECTSAGADDSV